MQIRPLEIPGRFRVNARTRWRPASSCRSFALVASAITMRAACILNVVRGFAGSIFCWIALSACGPTLYASLRQSCFDGSESSCATLEARCTGRERMYPADYGGIQGMNAEHAGACESATQAALRRRAFARAAELQMHSCQSDGGTPCNFGFELARLDQGDLAERFFEEIWRDRYKYRVDLAYEESTSLFEGSNGVPQRKALAIKLYDGICNTRYGFDDVSTAAKVCERLVQIYLSGDGVPTDRERAKEYATRAMRLHEGLSAWVAQHEAERAARAQERADRAEERRERAEQERADSERRAEQERRDEAEASERAANLRNLRPQGQDALDEMRRNIGGSAGSSGASGATSQSSAATAAQSQGATGSTRTTPPGGGMSADTICVNACWDAHNKCSGRDCGERLSACRAACGRPSGGHKVAQ